MPPKFIFFVLGPKGTNTPPGHDRPGGQGVGGDDEKGGMREVDGLSDIEVAEMGEVIYMGESKENIKYSDSNAVTLISSLSVLETRYKQELYESIMKYKKTGDSSIYKNTMAYKRFVAEVKNELPSFNEELFDPETLIRHRHVKVGMINERVIAQSASFILFGLCNYNTGEYMPLQTQCKERIFVVNREFIKKQLNMLNINSSTMYPDMDHKAMEIVKSYEE